VTSLKDLLRGTGTDLEVKHKLTRRGFLTTTHTAEKISIGNAIQLFNVNRKVGLIERFFLPRAFRMLLPDNICDAEDSQDSDDERPPNHTMEFSGSAVSNDYRSAPLHGAIINQCVGSQSCACDTYKSEISDEIQRLKMHVEDLLVQQKAEILAYIKTIYSESHTSQDKLHVSSMDLEHESREEPRMDRRHETACDFVGEVSHDGDECVRKMNLRIVDLAAKLTDIENFCQNLRIVQNGEDYRKYVSISAVLADYDHRIKSNLLSVSRLSSRIVGLAAKFTDIENFCQNLRVVQEGEDFGKYVSISAVLADYDHRIQSNLLSMSRLEQSFSNVLHMLRGTASRAVETESLPPHGLHLATAALQDQLPQGYLQA